MRSLKKISKIENKFEKTAYNIGLRHTDIKMTIKNLKGKDLLEISALNGDEVKELLELAKQLKSGKLQLNCSNKVLGLLFYKASTRTRVSFSVAMYQLGGQVIDLNPNVTQVGRGEPITDTARVLDRYLDILAVRTFKQADLETFAEYAEIPVIPPLSNFGRSLNY